MTRTETTIIMGVDPGVLRTGYGVLEKNGRKISVLDAGVIRPVPHDQFPERIYFIFSEIRVKLREFHVETMAIEKLFAVYKHPSTAIQMGHARGAILCAAAGEAVPVTNLAATHVKKAITGSGHADKTQIQRAIMLRLGLKEKPTPFDKADALAIALCAALEINLGELNKER